MGPRQDSGRPSEELRRRVHVLVAGRVQGVFFRAATREKASSLSLTGWVRNRSDGSVEIDAEGGASSIEVLLQWCAKGPPRARVDRVDWHEQIPTGRFHDFAVAPDA